jgi:PDZ domain-containing protein
MSDAPAPPEADSGPLPTEPSAERKKMPLWGTIGLTITAVLGIIALAGFWIRVPYSTIAPGAAVRLNDKVDVEGTTAFPPDGAIELLFVRERSHVNLWRYLQAKLDNDIDLRRDEELNPSGDSRSELRQEAEQAMRDAKNAAAKVALERAGYTVPQDDGLVVSGLFDGLPAEKVLELGDIILRADGKVIERNRDLTEIIGDRTLGEQVELLVLRDGKRQTVRVDVGEDPDPQSDRLLIGVLVSPRFQFPVTIDVDTAGIGGPSAGLAIALAILDEITPGNLTGGLDVAVTGTIDFDGNVGPIGGIEQKAVAARASGAKVLIVPACPNGDTVCVEEVRRAKERVGDDVKVVPVLTFEGALVALREAGGDAVTPVAGADRAA